VLHSLLFVSSLVLWAFIRRKPVKQEEAKL